MVVTFIYPSTLVSIFRGDELYNQLNEDHICINSSVLTSCVLLTTVPLQNSSVLTHIYPNDIVDSISFPTRVGIDSVLTSQSHLLYHKDSLFLDGTYRRTVSNGTGDFTMLSSEVPIRVIVTNTFVRLGFHHGYDTSNINSYLNSVDSRVYIFFGTGHIFRVCTIGVRGVGGVLTVIDRYSCILIVRVPNDSLLVDIRHLHSMVVCSCIDRTDIPITSLTKDYRNTIFVGPQVAYIHTRVFTL